MGSCWIGILVAEHLSGGVVLRLTFVPGVYINGVVQYVLTIETGRMRGERASGQGDGVDKEL